MYNLGIKGDGKKPPRLMPGDKLTARYAHSRCAHQLIAAVALRSMFLMAPRFALRLSRALEPTAILDMRRK